MFQIQTFSEAAILPLRIYFWPRRLCVWMSRIGLCFALVLLVSCSSQPKISKANVKLVEKLKTAVAAKKTDWLEAAAKQIDLNRRQGKLSDEEYAALEPILLSARQGHWDDANAQLTGLIKAQYP